MEISDRLSVRLTSADVRKYENLHRAFKSGEMSTELKKYPEVDFIEMTSPDEGI